MCCSEAVSVIYSDWIPGNPPIMTRHFVCYFVHDDKILHINAEYASAIPAIDLARK